MESLLPYLDLFPCEQPFHGHVQRLGDPIQAERIGKFSPETRLHNFRRHVGPGGEILMAQAGLGQQGDEPVGEAGVGCRIDGLVPLLFQL